MKQISEVIDLQKQRQLTTQSKQLEETKSKELNTEAKTAITCELGSCLLVQNTFGKKEEDFPNILKVFFLDLAEFEPKDIVACIRQWRKTQPNFPTVSDLRKLLAPEPQFNGTIYNNLIRKKRANDYLNDQEEAYLKRFEQEMMKGA